MWSHWGNSARTGALPQRSPSTGVTGGNGFLRAPTIKKCLADDTTTILWMTGGLVRQFSNLPKEAKHSNSAVSRAGGGSRSLTHDLSQSNCTKHWNRSLTMWRSFRSSWRQKDKSAVLPKAFIGVLLLNDVLKVKFSHREEKQKHDLHVSDFSLNYHKKSDF